VTRFAMSGRLRIKHDAGKAIFCRWRIRAIGLNRPWLTPATGVVGTPWTAPAPAARSSETDELADHFSAYEGGRAYVGR
jgi:hypothetical protein